MKPTRFAEHAAAWLAEKADTTRVTTWKDYESVVRVHLLPALGGRRVKSISAEDVKGVLASVSDLRTAKVRPVVKQLLPAVDVPKIRTRARRPQAVPSPAEVQALAEAAPWGGDLILTAAYTGLRWGELAALQAGSIDQGKRQIHVQRSAPATTRQVQEPKTRNSARTVVYGLAWTRPRPSSVSG